MSRAIHPSRAECRGQAVPNADLAATHLPDRYIGSGSSEGLLHIRQDEHTFPEYICISELLVYMCGYIDYNLSASLSV